MHLLTIKGYALDTGKNSIKKSKAAITVDAGVLGDVLGKKLTVKQAKKAAVVIVP
ncbi:MAG TPA: hypothetical protein VJL89_01870 [Thermodesulfovibrionia bacterium]|nr:hypothetical protein [Thermodesulfovibrionia bacterium]